MVKLRSEEIRSEHGGRGTEIHGCYNQLLLNKLQINHVYFLL